MAKYWIFLMPLLILLEGAVYLWLAIWCLVLRDCSRAVTDITKNPFEYVMHLIYFYDNACGPPQLKIPGNTGLVSLDCTNTAEPTESRNFIFIICYVIISTLWILSAVWCLLTCLCCAHRSVKLLSYGSCFTVVLIGCILDAVATGFNIHNIVHTTSASKTFEYLGITSDATVINHIKAYDAYFIAPSIVMVCITSRIVLIWLLNLSGISSCLQYVLKMPKDEIIATSTNAAN